MSALDLRDALAVALLHQRREAGRNAVLSLAAVALCLAGSWLGLW
jgi:hypothetical protein